MNSETRDIKLVKLDTERAVYEEGWWMTREDFDYANGFRTYGGVLVPNRNFIGWDRDEETKQLTYFHLP